MAYREKLAWVELVGMTLAYGAYFVAIAMLSPGNSGRDATLTYVALFAGATVIRVLVLGGGWLMLRMTTPAADRTRPDERDRAIARRGASSAYYVLLVMTMWVGVVLPLADSGWRVANSALAAIVIAEMVRLAVAAFSYRRGWHG